MDITFVQFEGAQTSGGEIISGTWGDFVAELEETGHERAKDKLKLTLVVPAVFQRGATHKSEKYVEAVTMGGLDFDNLTQEQFETVIRRILDDGLEALVYSTWGHAEAYRTKGLYKIRVLVPFTRHVDKAEWGFFWPIFNGLFAGLGDGKCKDPTRGYFLPAAPEGTSDDDLFLYHHEGKPLDVDHLLSALDTMDASALVDYVDEGREKIAIERLEKVSKKWKRARGEHQSWMGELLYKVVKGKPFAEEGERDTTVYKLAQDLGREFPNASAASIAEHFEQSLSAMGHGAPSIQDVQDKIQRAQHTERVERAVQERRELLNLQAIKRKLKHTSYDKECITAFAEATKSGSVFENFTNRLIIQCGSSYYVFTGSGYYGPKTASEVPTICRDFLMPAKQTLGASIYNVSDKGFETAKPLSQLMLEYGTIAVGIEARAGELCSFYEESTGIFVESWYVTQDIEAREVPEVDQWIDAICPDSASAENFRDWLAAVTDLNRPTSMLILIGPSGLGKTAFATGLSKLWGARGWAQMSTMLTENYNNFVKKSPLLLADETLPTDYRGHVPSAKLRSLISSNQHVINGKFMAISELRCYFRLVVAVNSMENVSFGKVFNREDVKAISNRLLFIDVNESSEERRQEAARLFDYERFVNKDGIAQHSLWLQENRRPSVERFVTKAQGGGVLAKIVIKTQSAAEVLSWCLWFLHNRRLEQDRELPAFVAKGCIHLNARSVCKHWEACFGSRASISEKVLAKAINLVSTDTVRVRIGGYRLRYLKIDPIALREYASESEWELEELEKHLTIYSECTDGIGFPVHVKPTEEEVTRKRHTDEYFDTQKALSASDRASGYNPSLAALEAEEEEMEALRRQEKELEEAERVEGFDDSEVDSDDDDEMLTEDD